MNANHWTRPLQAVLRASQPKLQRGAICPRGFPAVRQRDQRPGTDDLGQRHRPLLSHPDFRARRGQPQPVQRRVDRRVRSPTSTGTAGLARQDLECNAFRCAIRVRQGGLEAFSGDCNVACLPL